MRLIFIILCFTIFLSAHTINDKLILAYSKDKTDLTNKLYEIEQIFIDDMVNLNLFNKYELTTQIETMKQFYILTIKPIKDKNLKINLEILLNQNYPNMYFISNIEKKHIKKENIKKPIKPIFKVSKLKIITFMEIVNNIGLEWIALLFLSIIGLLYSLYSRKKSILIDKNQNRLKENQSDVEEEFNKMEKMNG